MSEAEIWRITIPGQPRQKKYTRPYFKGKKSQVCSYGGKHKIDYNSRHPEQKNQTVFQK
jgi:hypothetical protein